MLRAAFVRSSHTMWKKYFVDCLNMLFCTKAVPFCCSITLLRFKSKRTDCTALLSFLFRFDWTHCCEYKWPAHSRSSEPDWCTCCSADLRRSPQLFREPTFWDARKTGWHDKLYHEEPAVPLEIPTPWKFRLSCLSFLSKEDFVTKIFPKTCFSCWWIIP